MSIMAYLQIIYLVINLASIIVNLIFITFITETRTINTESDSISFMNLRS